MWSRFGSKFRFRFWFSGCKSQVVSRVKVKVVKVQGQGPRGGKWKKVEVRNGSATWVGGCGGLRWFANCESKCWRKGMSQTPQRQDNRQSGQVDTVDETRFGITAYWYCVQRAMWEGNWKLAPRFVLRDKTGLLR